MTSPALAVRLLTLDPGGLGGVWLRGPGPARDAVVEALKAASAGRVRRLPVAIDDERLLGGIDLGATLAAASAVHRPGLLAEADGGLLLIGSAERMENALAGRIAGVMDRGCIEAEVDGARMAAPARFGIVLIDDGTGDERPPAALIERAALWLDCTDEAMAAPTSGGEALAGSARADDAAMAALADAAAALAVRSDRALVLALRCACAHAALYGRATVTLEDLAAAAALVLAPRATRLPPQPEADAPPPPSAPEPGGGEGEQEEVGTLADRVIEAAQAAIPADLLARLAEGASRGPSPRGGGMGERRRARSRGRPAGVRPGLPRGGARLALVATLWAAIPWQRLRGRAPDGPVAVRRDDLRVRRFVARAESTAIFAVDASGSSAAARLAEAKGAVELMLAQTHVTRAEVALIAFRGTGAELLLPPTRSLTRARRALADLPGGGGTPLAAGLEAARALAGAVKAKGRTAALVVLTDGRANVGSNGLGGRAAATADAEAAARRIAQAGIPGLVMDIAARPDPAARNIAAIAGLRYLPLPRADAAALARAIQPTL